MSTPDKDFVSLFEHMSDPALVIDEEGWRVEACNDSFAALAVRTCSNVRGTPVSTLLHFDGKDEDGRYERATLFVNGEHPVHVSIERLGCNWDGRAALLCIVRSLNQQGRQDAEQDVVTSAEMSALFDYLREATEQLEVVNRVVAAVNSSRTIDDVFNRASEQMRALVPFDRASIALSIDDGRKLRVLAISGEHKGSLSIGAVAPMQGSVTEFALSRREMVVISDLTKEKRFNPHADLEQEGFRSSVCCPLFSMRRAIGSLNLTSRRKDAFERKHLLALERLGAPLAIAIEKVLLLEEAERRSREMESAAQREELAARIARRLSSSLDPSSVLQETVDDLGHALRADRCHISLFDNYEESYALVDYEFLSGAGVPSMRGHRVPLASSAYARRVLSSEEPVAVADIEEIEESELRSLYQLLGVRSLLAAPVFTSGVPRGLVELHSTAGEQREWTAEDAKLLGTVAREISVALTNARLYSVSRRRSEELEGLYKISRVFSTLTDTAEIYGTLAESIAQLVGGEMCLIATYDRRQDMVRAEAPGYNTPPSMTKGFQFKLSRESSDAYIHQTGEPFFSNDPATDERFDSEFVTRYQIRSALSVPMRIKRELIGFIYVANRPGGFRERDMRLLEIFAAQAAETIANARLFKTIQAQAEREAIVNRLLLILQRATDPKDSISVVVGRVGEILDADRCVAMLFADNERADYFGEWCRKGVASIAGDEEVRERTPVPYWIRTHRQPLVVTDMSEHPLAVGFEDLLERLSLKSLAAVPIIHQGRVIGMLSAHQTRSHRRWAEDDVDLLTAVATQVGSMLENARLITELREANRLKDEFLATLSHELRTPLTAIKGWVELLSENELIETDEEFSDGIEVIRNSTTALTQLISDLLDLSRIQRRGLNLERRPCDINEAIEEATQAVRQSVSQRRQHLEVTLDERLPQTVADAQRIQQVLWNLLNNAIKFTPDEGTISVRSRLIDSTGILINDDESEAIRWIVIEVSDTGEGIPPDFLPFVFDRFRQADASSRRRHGGLGIGLALVKELVEAHGGHVEAKSEERGATFTVHLPVISAERFRVLMVEESDLQTDTKEANSQSLRQRQTLH
ncbi:MAG TPA: GAF domain-containing protein [Pyrinomonadaceae bacterium]|nr:GAF domain-containing protein [Pyrinomonadaceae bacterium]